MAAHLIGFLSGGARCAGIIPGDELGLYRAMAEATPCTAAAVAAVTGPHRK